MKAIYLFITLLLVVGCQRDEIVPTPESSSSHDEHSIQQPADEQHAHDKHKRGQQVTLKIETTPATPQRLAITKYAMSIPNEHGQPISRYDVLHEKLVHLIVVREGLDEFAHLHPEVGSDGRMTGEYSFPQSGKFLLFADYRAQGQSQGLASGTISVMGEDASALALSPNESPEVAFDRGSAHIKIEKRAAATVMSFQLLDLDGKPMAPLEPYLGAMGHLVIISANGQSYVHAHPIGSQTQAPDGIVEFEAHFPAPGLYKAWGQFQIDGAITTVPYVIDYQTTQHADHNHE
jgi:hypothetical protein